MKRSSGILLAVSSLPSEYGIGCFDRTAYEFIDNLCRAGQRYWQILPLSQTSFGDSPYQSFSSFAGNPYFISNDKLVEEGLLTKEECVNADFGDDACCVDYKKLYENRYPLLEKAFSRSDILNNADFHEFCEKHSYWLDDYALFMAIKDYYGGIPWNEWADRDIRMRKPEIVKIYKDKLADKILFYKFLQYHFYKQWNELKCYAERQSIEIIGDIPIYTAYDSADVWSNPQLFQLDENYLPVAVAGCPPDGFSADGQLWGNPLYDWDKHDETDYKWWISRLAHCFDIYDVVRIDHFRGFDEYYSIPYGESTAKNGHWEKGAGIRLFKAVEQALGKKQIIAEDLGFVTDSVRQLVKDCGFPNMKVLQFAFDSRDTGSANDYLPHNYTENCVAYTGTHDNQTVLSWFQTISDEERKKARDYLCDYYTPDSCLNRAFISLIMRSRADICIIPLQDWLGLDDSARMNTPSTVGENWKWRVDRKDLTDKLWEEIYNITRLYGR